MSEDVVTAERLAHTILFLRSQKVLLDFHLAALCVTTKAQKREIGFHMRETLPRYRTRASR